MKPILSTILLAFALLSVGQSKKIAKEAALNQQRYQSWDCLAITDPALRLKCIDEKVKADDLAKQKASRRVDSLRDVRNDSILRVRPKDKVAPMPTHSYIEPAFISAYGRGSRGLAEVESRGSNEYLTPVTFVDYNHVYSRINDFLRYQLSWTELTDPVWTGASFVSNYQTPGENVKLIYEVSAFEQHFYITRLRIAGDRMQVIKFFLTYWPHGFNERNVKADETAAYTYMLDRIAYSQGVIIIENQTIKNHQEFVQRLTTKSE